MNEQVQEFLEEQKKKAKQERDNHLCKLGLYDLEKCTKSYSASPWKNEEDARNFGYLYKDEKGWFKLIGKRYAISVTDEEYEEICKVCPMPVNKKDEFSEALLDKIDSIRKMVKFFTILAATSLILAFLIGYLLVFSAPH